MDDQPMTARDRYVNTLLFKGTDRAPLVPGYGRESTHNRWYQEGLPKGTRNIAEYAYREAGGTLDWPETGEDFYLDAKMIPTFEEKVIQKRTHPARFSDDARETGKRLADRKHPIVINIGGPFWQLREWLGFERLCLLFHDDPGWIKEMIAFWEDFVIRLLGKLFTYLLPEHVHFSEDMAYKAHPMIGPAMTREFLLPSWSRWSGTCHDAGVRVVGIDSDGDVSTLIPLMIEAGFDYVDPMEVAAGNDLPACRKNYGRKVAFGGGIDKREIAKGGEHIVRELDRLKPVIESGGYIPSCDHAIPVDVGWADFVHYVRTLAKATGWL
jgi:hypothetical protein